MVGVLINDAGRVLIAQRTGKQHAGSWEFPGGKLEAGEARLAGLARELREELGISIESPRPLIRVTHSYSYGQVLLDVWVIRRFTGEPQGLDGQALRWCIRNELMDSALLPADKPIVAALALPERLCVADTSEYCVETFGSDARSKDGPRLRGLLCSTAMEAREAAWESADFLVLRDPLPPWELAELCGAIALPIYAAGIDLEAAWALGASGINQLGL
jgi:mutator protein MutT